MFKWMVIVTDPMTGESNTHRFETPAEVVPFLLAKSVAGYVVDVEPITIPYYGGLNSL